MLALHLATLLALLPALVLGISHASINPRARRHAEIELSGRGTESLAPTNATHTLEKRFDNARFSYFVTGLGACGNYNTPSDFIVALNIPQYGNGEHCGQTITISWGGKTTTATVADRCVECPYGAIDLTEGLFVYLAGSTNAGYLYGTWNFGSGPAPEPPTTTTKEKPTPTTTSTPPPPETTSSTSTWSPSPTPSSSSTSHSHSRSSTESSTTSASSVVSTSSAASSTESSTSATSSSSSSTAAPTPISALEAVQLAYAQLAILIASGEQLAKSG